ELQVVKQGPVEWVLISPWDGKWPISKKSLTVVVARRGDKEILTSGKALEALTTRVLKNLTAKQGRQISEDRRNEILRQQAQAVGLTPQEVDQAIREWGKKATDSYQQGLAALYESSFARAEQLLTESYKQRRGAFQDAAFFLGRTLYEEGKYAEA